MSAAVKSPLEFVDSNVLIYAHDITAGGKHQRARSLLARLWQERSGGLSVQVLQEFVVNVTVKVPRPLTTAEASTVVDALAAWSVHSPGAADVVAALELRDRYRVSFWDAMILQSASRLDCRILWSEDLNAGQRFANLEVRNPFAPGAEL